MEPSEVYGWYYIYWTLILLTSPTSSQLFEVHYSSHKKLLLLGTAYNFLLFLTRVNPFSLFSIIFYIFEAILNLSPLKYTRFLSYLFSSLYLFSKAFLFPLYYPITQHNEICRYNIDGLTMVHTLVELTFNNYFWNSLVT